MYKPQAFNWWALWLRGYNSSHIDLYFTAQKKKIRTNIYISNNKELFEVYKSHKDEIEKQIGSKIYFTKKSKDCTVVVERSGDVTDRDKWEEFFQWQIDNAVKLKEVIKKYDK